MSQVQIVTFHQPTTVDKEPLLFGSGFGEMHPQGLSVWVGVSEKSSGVSKGYPFGTNLWKKGCIHGMKELMNRKIYSIKSGLGSLRFLGGL